MYCILLNKNIRTSILNILCSIHEVYRSIWRQVKRGLNVYLSPFCHKITSYDLTIPWLKLMKSTISNITTYVMDTVNSIPLLCMGRCSKRFNLWFKNSYTSMGFPLFAPTPLSFAIPAKVIGWTPNNNYMCYFGKFNK